MFANNSVFRNWDYPVYFRRGKIKETGRKNPYNKNSLEFHLINFVLDLKDKSLNQIKNPAKKVIKYLATKKFIHSLDPWSLYYLDKKAVWLALSSGCIKFEKEINSDCENSVKKFAVFLESGMLDLLHEPEYIEELEKNCPGGDKRITHLKAVSFIASQIKKEFGLPTMKKQGDKIEITNFNHWIYDTVDSIPLKSNYEKMPLQTWYKPSSSFVKANTRGIYHHLGDEMGFITAAMQYGECYVVGNDEFGDLMVLAYIGKKGSTYKSLRMGEICDPMDFDYIYGVPRSNALYPSHRNNIFNYSSENYDQCKINTAKNSQLSDAFWNNEVFMKYAGRSIECLTVDELSLKMQNIIESVFSSEDLIKYKTFFCIEKIKKLQLLFLISNPNIKNKFNHQKDKYNDLFIEMMKVFRVFRKQSSATFQKQTRENFLENYTNLILIKCKENKDILEEENIQSDDVTQLIVECFLMMKEMYFLAEKYNKIIEEKLSFFYKTVAHKVHCDILNPKKLDDFGFFMKDGDKQHFHMLNLHDLLREILCDVNYSDEISQINVSKSIYNKSLSVKKKYVERFIKSFSKDVKNHYYFQLIKNNFGSRVSGEQFDDLIDYWKSINVKSFVVSNLVDMQNEYRIFVINGRAVAATPCFRNTTPFNAWEGGRFDPRLCNGHSALDVFLTQESRDKVALYAKFIRKFCKELKIKYPDQKSFVIDLAYSKDANDGKGGVVPIEVNSITWSGAYQLDFRRVCAAIAGKIYNKKELMSFDSGKWIDYPELLSNAEEILLGEIKNDSNLLDSVDFQEEDFDDDKFEDEDNEGNKVL